MMTVQKITTLDLPELAAYRTMKYQQAQRDQRIFVAEGEKVVRRLLESNFRVLSVLAPEKWLREYEPLLLARQETVPVYSAEKTLLETLTGFSMYQGVLAVGQVPEPASLEQILAAAPRPWLFLAADGVSNAQNVGGLMRNCAALGAQALIIGETSASAYLRRAVRGSMGAIFKLPILETESLQQLLSAVRRHGIRTIAAHPHADNHLLSQANLKGDCCLVLGSEGNGIAPEILAVCDDAVSVPMRLEVDSLNVGNAAAVFLYEAARQRGWV
jgi:tRNA G18 (ribose-2'-O)-methylase SpoU